MTYIPLHSANENGLRVERRNELKVKRASNKGYGYQKIKLLRNKGTAVKGREKMVQHHKVSQTTGN